MSKACWLIGAGYMATEYIKVLKELTIDIVVIGRGEEKVKTIRETFDVNALSGGLSHFLESGPTIPEYAIVAVPVNELVSVTIKLLNAGVKDILIEKPAGLNQDDIDRLVSISGELNANIYIAYNRRFYKSIEILRNKVLEDGGITSVNFEFTEWAHVIETCDHPKETLNKFVLANSTHIIDTVFNLIGRPKILHSQVTGNSISWHPSGSVFMGVGISEMDIPFNYNANWDAPGRWAIEVLTNKNRYYLKPLERLSVQRKGTVQIEEIDGDFSCDINFKPGVLNMVKAFFEKDEDTLCTLKDHQKSFYFYEKIAGYRI